MPLTWVLFDLNGTLVDPSVLAQPLGDTADADEAVYDALDQANAQAMVAMLTGEHPPFPSLIEAGLRRFLELAGGDPAAAGDAVALLATMPAYIEAPAALERLRGEGLKLGVLTQSSTEAGEDVLRFAGLRDRMDLVVGSDVARVYKPDPRSYRSALDAAGVPPADACMVATHWWDVTGAKRAGLRTGWVARRERVLLSTVPEPDFRGRDLEEVAEAILAES
jgi:2-haloacid dehalogenase